MSYQPPYQQGGYYPPPQQGYGAPPPPPHGGAPYGAPAGAPYGAPPAAPYGAPPPAAAYGQPAGYGAPPPPVHAQPMLYNGTPIPAPPPNQPSPPPPGYNALADVDSIRKATKGFGTDEKLLISTLAPLDAFQIDAVSKQFKMAAGKDIVAVIEKETSGYFEYALRLKALGPVAGDCWLVNRACAGAGTHEDLLNEVLLSRTNQDIWTLKQAYRAIYNKDMEKVVEGELSMKTRRMFAMALQGARMEDSVPVDPNAVEADVAALKSAARGAGTDEITICSILVSRSAPHLAAIARSYAARYKEPLSAMIASEFSGHMLDALLYIAHGAQGHGMGIERDAKLLEESMAGMGTKDERLAYRVIRMHWNRHRFEEIKRAYAGLCSKKGLKARVEGETSGDFKRFLSAVIGH